MAQVTLYCQETPGLKLGPGTIGQEGSVPGSVIVFADGYATFDPTEYPDWARWAFAPGSPYIRVLEGDEAPDGVDCPECGKTFKTDRALNGHLMSHKRK